jgi:hypothetical protein
MNTGTAIAIILGPFFRWLAIHEGFTLALVELEAHIPSDLDYERGGGRGLADDGCRTGGFGFRARRREPAEAGEAAIAIVQRGPRLHAVSPCFSGRSA